MVSVASCPRSCSWRTQARKGAAVVELAVCLPVIVLIVLGTIEATDMVFLRHRLTTAAYEAARMTSAPGQTSAAGVSAGTTVLTSRGIQGGSVTISPAASANTPTGTEIAATVTAPFSSNCSLTPIVMGGSGNVTVTVRMIRQ